MISQTTAEMLSGLSNPCWDPFTVRTMPYNHLVPKELKGNLRFRKEINRLGSEDPQTARDIRVMASRDPLFFVNTFGWGYDPRHKMRVEPFILYDFQEQALVEIITATGLVEGHEAHDVVIEKSRDMGATFVCQFSHLWLWLFRDMTTFLWVSRNEGLVDTMGDPDSMFWKADFLLKMLPLYMKPHFERKQLHLKNLSNGSTINGCSSTGDMGRGGRRTSVLLDEFASVDNDEHALSSTGDVTECRIMNSTPKPGSAMYRLKKAGTPCTRFHWSMHPRKAAGLYTYRGGKLEIIDKEYKFPEGYKFIQTAPDGTVLEGRPRSAWYDKQCKRRASAKEIAQELDIYWEGSGARFFDMAVLENIKRTSCRPPLHRGRLEYKLDYEQKKISDVRWVADSLGPLYLWFHPDGQGKPGADRNYAAGSDISTGSGSSNSCTGVADLKTMEKCAELVTPHRDPSEFAFDSAALAMWFTGQSGRGAYMAWEGTGPGGQFGKVVASTGYTNVYYRPLGKGKRAPEPGWWSTGKTKYALLWELRRAYAARNITERSMEAVVEAEEYIYDGAAVIHQGAKKKDDPSSAAANHGDRCMATALLWMAMQEQRQYTLAQPKAIPARCLYRRMQEFDEEQRRRQEEDE